MISSRHSYTLCDAASEWTLTELHLYIKFNLFFSLTAFII